MTKWSDEARRKAAQRRLARLQALADEVPEFSADMQAEINALHRGKPPLTARQRLEAKRANWRHQAAKRHAAKLQRTPPWADLDAIRALHVQASRLTLETGIAHHVDHVIPLQGRLVSGLHVHTNLRIITGFDNSSKCNKFDSDGGEVGRKLPHNVVRIRG